MYEAGCSGGVLVGAFVVFCACGVLCDWMVCVRVARSVGRGRGRWSLYGCKQMSGFFRLLFGASVTS